MAHKGRRHISNSRGRGRMGALLDRILFWCCLLCVFSSTLLSSVGGNVSLSLSSSAIHNNAPFPSSSASSLFIVRFVESQSTPSSLGSSISGSTAAPTATSSSATTTFTDATTTKPPLLLFAVDLEAAKSAVLLGQQQEQQLRNTIANGGYSNGTSMSIAVIPAADQPSPSALQTLTLFAEPFIGGDGGDGESGVTYPTQLAMGLQLLSDTWRDYVSTTAATTATTTTMGMPTAFDGNITSSPTTTSAAASTTSTPSYASSTRRPSWNNGVSYVRVEQLMASVPSYLDPYGVETWVKEVLSEREEVDDDSSSSSSSSVNYFDRIADGSTASTLLPLRRVKFALAGTVIPPSIIIAGSNNFSSIPTIVMDFSAAATDAVGRSVVTTSTPTVNDHRCFAPTMDGYLMVRMSVPPATYVGRDSSSSSSSTSSSSAAAEPPAEEEYRSFHIRTLYAAGERLSTASAQTLGVPTASLTNTVPVRVLAYTATDTAESTAVTVVVIVIGCLALCILVFFGGQFDALLIMWQLQTILMLCLSSCAPRSVTRLFADVTWMLWPSNAFGFYSKYNPLLLSSELLLHALTFCGVMIVALGINFALARIRIHYTRKLNRSQASVLSHQPHHGLYAAPSLVYPTSRGGGGHHSSYYDDDQPTSPQLQHEQSAFSTLSGITGLLTGKSGGEEAYAPQPFSSSPSPHGGAGGGGGRRSRGSSFGPNTRRRSGSDGSPIRISLTDSIADHGGVGSYYHHGSSGGGGGGDREMSTVLYNNTNGGGGGGGSAAAADADLLANGLLPSAPRRTNDEDLLFGMSEEDDDELYAYRQQQQQMTAVGERQRSTRTANLTPEARARFPAIFLLLSSLVLPGAVYSASRVFSLATNLSVDELPFGTSSFSDSLVGSMLSNYYNGGGGGGGSSSSSSSSSATTGNASSSPSPFTIPPLSSLTVRDRLMLMDAADGPSYWLAPLWSLGLTSGVALVLGLALVYASLMIIMRVVTRENFRRDFSYGLRASKGWTLVDMLLLKRSGEWVSVDSQYKYGLLYDGLDGGSFWFQMPFIVGLVLIAIVAGQMPLSPQGCTGNAYIHLIVAAATMLLMVIRRPYICLSFNIFNIFIAGAHLLWSISLVLTTSCSDNGHMFAWTMVWLWLLGLLLKSAFVFVGYGVWAYRRYKMAHTRKELMASASASLTTSASGGGGGGADDGGRGKGGRHGKSKTLQKKKGLSSSLSSPSRGRGGAVGGGRSSRSARGAPQQLSFWQRLRGGGGARNPQQQLHFSSSDEDAEELLLGFGGSKHDAYLLPKASLLDTAAAGGVAGDSGVEASLHQLPPSVVASAHRDLCRDNGRGGGGIGLDDIDAGDEDSPERRHHATLMEKARHRPLLTRSVPNLTAASSSFASSSPSHALNAFGVTAVPFLASSSSSSSPPLQFTVALSSRDSRIILRSLVAAILHQDLFVASRVGLNKMNFAQEEAELRRVRMQLLRLAAATGAAAGGDFDIIDGSDGDSGDSRPRYEYGNDGQQHRLFYEKLKLQREVIRHRLVQVAKAEALAAEARRGAAGGGGNNDVTDTTVRGAPSTPSSSSFSYRKGFAAPPSPFKEVGGNLSISSMKATNIVDANVHDGDAQSGGGILATEGGVITSLFRNYRHNPLPPNTNGPSSPSSSSSCAWLGGGIVSDALVEHHMVTQQQHHEQSMVGGIISDAPLHSGGGRGRALAVPLSVAIRNAETAAAVLIDTVLEAELLVEEGLGVGVGGVEGGGGRPSSSSSRRVLGRLGVASVTLKKLCGFGPLGGLVSPQQMMRGGGVGAAPFSYPAHKVQLTLPSGIAAAGSLPSSPSHTSSSTSSPFPSSLFVADRGACRVLSFEEKGTSSSSPAGSSSNKPRGDGSTVTVVASQSAFEEAVLSAAPASIRVNVAGIVMMEPPQPPSSSSSLSPLSPSSPPYHNGREAFSSFGSSAVVQIEPTTAQLPPSQGKQRAVAVESAIKTIGSVAPTAVNTIVVRGSSTLYITSNAGVFRCDANNHQLRQNTVVCLSAVLGGGGPMEEVHTERRVVKRVRRNGNVGGPSSSTAMITTVAGRDASGSGNDDADDYVVKKKTFVSHYCFPEKGDAPLQGFVKGSGAVVAGVGGTASSSSSATPSPLLQYPMGACLYTVPSAHQHNHSPVAPNSSIMANPTAAAAAAGTNTTLLFIADPKAGAVLAMPVDGAMVPLTVEPFSNNSNASSSTGRAGNGGGVGGLASYSKGRSSGVGDGGGSGDLSAATTTTASACRFAPSIAVNMVPLLVAVATPRHLRHHLGRAALSTEERIEDANRNHNHNQNHHHLDDHNRSNATNGTPNDTRHHAAHLLFDRVVDARYRRYLSSPPPTDAVVQEEGGHQQSASASFATAAHGPSSDSTASNVGQMRTPTAVCVSHSRQELFIVDTDAHVVWCVGLSDLSPSPSSTPLVKPMGGGAGDNLRLGGGGGDGDPFAHHRHATGGMLFPKAHPRMTRAVGVSGRDSDTYGYYHHDDDDGTRNNHHNHNGNTHSGRGNFGASNSGGDVVATADAVEEEISAVMNSTTTATILFGSRTRQKDANTAKLAALRRSVERGETDGDAKVVGADPSLSLSPTRGDAADVSRASRNNATATMATIPLPPPRSALQTLLCYPTDATYVEASHQLVVVDCGHDGTPAAEAVARRRREQAAKDRAVDEQRAMAKKGRREAARLRQMLTTMGHSDTHDDDLNLNLLPLDNNDVDDDADEEAEASYYRQSSAAVMSALEQRLRQLHCGRVWIIDRSHAMTSSSPSTSVARLILPPTVLGGTKDGYLVPRHVALLSGGGYIPNLSSFVPSLLSDSYAHKTHPQHYHAFYEGGGGGAMVGGGGEGEGEEEGRERAAAAAALPQDPSTADQLALWTSSAYAYRYEGGGAMPATATKEGGPPSAPPPPPPLISLALSDPTHGVVVRLDVSLCPTMRQLQELSFAAKLGEHLRRRVGGGGGGRGGGTRERERDLSLSLSPPLRQRYSPRRADNATKGAAAAAAANDDDDESRPIVPVTGNARIGGSPSSSLQNGSSSPFGAVRKSATTTTLPTHPHDAAASPPPLSRGGRARNDSFIRNAQQHQQHQRDEGDVEFVIPTTEATAHVARGELDDFASPSPIRVQQRFARHDDAEYGNPYVGASSPSVGNHQAHIPGTSYSYSDHTQHLVDILPDIIIGSSAASVAGNKSNPTAAEWGGGGNKGPLLRYSPPQPLSIAVTPSTSPVPLVVAAGGSASTRTSPPLLPYHHDPPPSAADHYNNGGGGGGRFTVRGDSPPLPLPPAAAGEAEDASSSPIIARGGSPAPASYAAAAHHHHGAAAASGASMVVDVVDSSLSLSPTLLRGEGEEEEGGAVIVDDLALDLELMQHRHKAHSALHQRRKRRLLLQQQQQQQEEEVALHAGREGGDVGDAAVVEGSLGSSLPLANNASNNDHANENADADVDGDGDLLLASHIQQRQRLLKQLRSGGANGDVGRSVDGGAKKGPSSSSAAAVAVAAVVARDASPSNSNGGPHFMPLPSPSPSPLRRGGARRRTFGGEASPPPNGSGSSPFWEGTAMMNGDDDAAAGLVAGKSASPSAPISPSRLLGVGGGGVRSTVASCEDPML